MISIIPKPNHIELTEGNYELKHGKICSEFEKLNNFFTDAFAEYNIKATIQKTAGNVKILSDKELEAEEYELFIDENGITISASADAGAFYGMQSLRQLLNQNYVEKDAITLPFCRLKDKPDFSHRSFMIDEARHFFGKDVVKEMIDIMALLKLNRLHWHLTEDQGWRVEIKKYPLLTEKGSVRECSQLSWVGVLTRKPKCDGKKYGEGCFYTQDDLKEIVAYAKDRQIEVYPEIDMPGHLLAAIACYPELSCFNEQVEVSKTWGIKKTIGCAGKDKLYEFIKDVIDELQAIFPAGYFHIGGDEAPKLKWKTCPDCQKKMQDNGLKNEHELQAYFSNEIISYLEKYGKRTVAWNEILNGDNLSDKTIVQYWIGSNKKKVNEWLEKGNNIIISKNSYLYMDYLYGFEYLKKSYNTDLEKLGFDAKYKKQILGYEAPIWTEFVNSKGKLEFQVFPRMMSLAEINWTKKENKNFADFEKRLENINKYLDKLGICYATKEFYSPTGLKGLLRKTTAQSDMAFRPYKEYEQYIESKSKEGRV